MFDLTACHVERTAEQDYRLRWRCDVPGRRVAVYMTEDPDRFYRSDDPGTIHYEEYW